MLRYHRSLKVMFTTYFLSPFHQINNYLILICLHNLDQTTKRKDVIPTVCHKSQCSGFTTVLMQCDEMCYLQLDSKSIICTNTQKQSSLLLTVFGLI